MGYAILPLTIGFIRATDLIWMLAIKITQKTKSQAWKGQASKSDCATLIEVTFHKKI